MPASTRFRLLVLSDLHYRAEPRILGAIERQAAAVRRIAPDLILVNGDAWNGAMAQPANEAAMAYSTLHEWAKTLEAPVEWVIGNHDLFDFRTDPAGSKRRAEDGLLHAPAVRRRALCPGWQLVVADSIQPDPTHAWGFTSSLGANQIETINNLSAGEDQVILAVHSPVLSAYHSYESGAYGAVQNRMLCEDDPQTLAKLRSGSIACIIQGHTHIRETVEYGGVKHITAGAACGNWWSGLRFGLHGPGAVILDLGERGLDIMEIDLPGP